MMFFGSPHLRARHLFALSASIMLLGLGAFLALPAKAQEAFEPTRFSVEVVGEGPDVILIPGLSTTREVWRPHLDALAGHRIHLLQVRGFGEDAGVNAEGPIMQPLIEEVARYIEANGIAQPAIIGHSMGGFVAMSLGAQHPDMRTDIAEIAAPVSVIVPHRAGFMTPAALLAFYGAQYAALPSAELVLVENAAHFVMVDQPEAFADAVQAFLQE